MSNPFNFPDWMPWWMQLLLLIVGILITLAFLLMPFSVFGVKSRLEAIEARLDEIQGEIRALALRLPEPGRRIVYEEEAPSRPMERVPDRVPDRAVERAPERAMERPIERPAERPAPARPPIPPAAWTPDGAPRRPIGAGVQPVRQEPGFARPRTEPRIDRFR
jgi:hypothetical protein